MLSETLKDTLAQEKASYDALIAHIRSFPSPQHPAVEAAAAAVEASWQRRARDIKLTAKFSKTNDAEFTQVPSNLPQEDAKPMQQEDAEEDWQAVGAPEDHPLSQAVVQSLKQHDVKLATPIQAVTVALHAALIHCSFVCTGLPPRSMTGFAPAVRAISTFLPIDWMDRSPLELRYRAKSGPAVLLRVAQDANQVHVVFGAQLDAPEAPCLSFALTDFVNVESFARAANGSRVPPALHYKQLSVLLQQFGATFDLGDEASSPPVPYRDSSVHRVHETLSQAPRVMQTGIPATGAPHFTLPGLQQNPHSFVPAGGDFRGDLAPGGLIGGGPLVDPSGMHGGTHMGPNHPMFRGGPAGGLPGGVAGMKPRFDPFGPPGWRPKPNNDALQPPNHFNSDMFM